MNSNFKLILIGLFLSLSISARSQTDKKIILELFNATWCANCPNASELIEDILATRSDVIPVALHFGLDDPMETEESLSIASIFSGASAPGCMIDRVHFPSEATVALSIDQANIVSHLNDRENDAVEVSVSLSNASFYANTRELSVDVNATFLSTIELTLLNFNLWIVEDLIVSFDPAYEQTGPTGQISAYPHRYVLREMIGEEWGTVGVVDVPTVNNGDSFSHTYTYTIPDEWNIDQLKIIGMIQKSQSFQSYDERPILNATSIQLSSLIQTSIEESFDKPSLKVYPNPMLNKVEIDFYVPSNGNYNLKVSDVLGKLIYNSEDYFYNVGWQNSSWSVLDSKGSELPPGIYYISVQSGEDVISTSKVVKN